jgi:hypothetical protein
MPMLKARIFSNYPEKADSLAEVLRQQGYLVEILRPDQAPGVPADLEIVLETCSSGDAIRRAAELAQEFDADVVVAPGTLIGMPVPDPAALPNPPALEDTRDFADVAAQTAHPFTEHEIKVPQRLMTPEASETYQQSNREAAAPHPSKPEPGLPGTPEWQPSESEPGFLGRVVPRAAVRLTAWATSAREALFLASNRSREYREHALTRFALLRTNREEHLLELTQRRIEAQEQASHLATARKNAAAYLLQLQHESGGVIRPSNREVSEQAIREAPVRPWRVLFASLIDRVRPVRWDVALAGLASAGALFAIGLAVASFSSKPNLTLGKEPPAAATPGPAPAAAPSQAAMTSAATTPKAAPSRVQSRKPSPAQHTASNRNRANASRDREDGNDVVVRHLVSPSPTPKQQAQGWKHFSDIDH